MLSCTALFPGLLVPSVSMQMPAPAVVLAEPSRAQVFPPTTNLQAAVPLYGGLGTAKANRANPAGGGNAEGNWWTPSYVLETDCEGNKVRDPSQLTPECIAKKKVAEIKSKQAITEQNAQYKVERLQLIEKRQADEAAKRAAQAAETKAKQAKYAQKR